MALALSKQKVSARAIALSAAALAFAIVLFTPSVLNDGDTYWHIAAGRWMLDNHAVLRIDPFSYTFAGHPWQTHEWLAEMVMALAYVGAGWVGIVLVFGAAAALTAGLLGRHLSRWLGGMSLAVTLFLALACVAGSLLTRPHLLALPLLELWTAGILIARTERRAPSWKLLPLMALWANLHASFVIGLLLLLPFGLEAVLEETSTRGTTLRRWCLFAVGAFAMALLTPYGLDGVIFPFRLMAMPSLQLVSEWSPTDLRIFQPLVFAVAAALYVLLSRGARIKPLRILVLLGLLYLALIHVRHHMLVGIIGALILAEPLAKALGTTPQRDTPRRGLRTAFGFAVIFVALGVLRFSLPLERHDNATTPGTALARVPAPLAKMPVFNDYAFGGYLIFNDVRPYIDSRAELYGDDFISHYVAMIHPDDVALQSMLDKRHVRWTILAPDNPAVSALDRMSGWHRLYSDRWAVVHVRDGAL